MLVVATVGAFMFRAAGSVCGLVAVETRAKHLAEVADDPTDRATNRTQQENDAWCHRYGAGAGAGGGVGVGAGGGAGVGAGGDGSRSVMWVSSLNRNGQARRAWLAAFSRRLARDGSRVGFSASPLAVRLLSSVPATFN